MPFKESQFATPDTGERVDNHESPKPTRRDFLKLALGGLALTEKLEARTESYRAGPLLAGRRFNNLYTDYTSISGTVPEFPNIDFEKQLTTLWERKKKVSGNNRVVVETGNQLVGEYRSKKHTKIELGPYINQIDGIINGVRKNLDWETYVKIKGLNPAESKLARELVYSFTGKDLTAYILTELMPSKDGVLNKEVLAFLLRNAGREYVESIPALHDPKTSFGPYQFTEYALYNAGGMRRGASIPNQALPAEHRIPGSVSKLRGLDHHKAAYLFLLDNVTNLVATASQKQLKTLSLVKNSKHSDLLSYAATAHHGPGMALRIARRWLDNGARFPYEVSCGPVYRKYAEKTKANLRALN